jgi:hypothetical protein
MIMASLRHHGAFVFKVWGSEHMMAGLPDVIGVYHGRFIAVETKMPGGRLSRRQVYVISKIEEAGGAVVVAQSVAEALTVLDKAVTPDAPRSALTDALRASSERPRSPRRVRGAAHVAELHRISDPD